MKKDFLALFRTHAAGTILSYVDNHQNTQYKDLLEFSTPYSMNRILKELQNWEFIQCFCDVVTGDNRVELTERGKTILEMLRELARIMKGDSPDTEDGTNEQRMIMTQYCALCEQVYENPLMPCKDIAEKTGIPLKKCYQYLTDMYDQ